MIVIELKIKAIIMESNHDLKTKSEILLVF